MPKKFTKHQKKNIQTNASEKLFVLNIWCRLESFKGSVGIMWNLCVYIYIHIFFVYVQLHIFMGVRVCVM